MSVSTAADAAATRVPVTTTAVFGRGDRGGDAVQDEVETEGEIAR
ncbi:hypothetical protein OG308_30510 [Nocardia salmonicida]|uniref:Uncharacterized protein n=1 Tax=Nocardia salmonicida TaxID=53431 RepID=A0ABZ1N6K5_9NOCA